jgi:hypothetical protein
MVRVTLASSDTPVSLRVPEVPRLLCEAPSFKLIRLAQYVERKFKVSRRSRQRTHNIENRGRACLASDRMAMLGHKPVTRLVSEHAARNAAVSSATVAFE